MKLMRILPGVLALLGVCAVSAADPAKVALVTKGELKEAKASWWGFDPADSTKFLQAAINSKVPRLIIDKQASPWVVSPLNGVGNQTLVFEDGAEIQAKKGIYKGLNDCLLRYENAENVTITGLGKGGILRMHKKDYTDRKNYKFSEWRHTLHVYGVKNLKVENMTFAASGGDGIYLREVKDVFLKKVICDDNYRQGMSIISGANIVSEDCQFINTSGTSPQSGVDVEPNHGNESVKGIVFRNCRFADNARWGLLIAVAHINSDVAGDLEVKCENCVFENNVEGEYYLFLRSLFHTDYPVTGTIEILNCVIRNNLALKRERPAIEFGLDLHHAVEIVVKDTKITRGKNKEKAMRIGFHYPNKANAKPQASIELDNVQFTDCSSRDALRIMDNGKSGATDYITGSIVDKSGRKHELDAKMLKRAGAKGEPEFDYDFSDREVKVAAPADGKMEEYPEFPLWQYATYWFYAQKDQEVKFELKFYKKIRFSKTTAVKLITPDGKESKLGEISPNETKTFSFKADAAGFYKVDMRSKDLRVALLKSNVPAGIMLNPYTHRFNGNSGTLYFNVPANAKEFAVRVWGLVFSHNFQGVKASIVDPDGKVVFSHDPIGEAVQYTAEGKAAAKAGVWKVTFGKASKGWLGEYNLRLMGVSPYVGLREDRTPVLGGKSSKLPEAKVQNVDSAYF